MAAGHSCTVHTYTRTLQWFSDHWPADLEWPADISRPAPSPDSPAAQAAASISVSGSETEIGDSAVSVSTSETEIDPIAAVEAAQERQGAALDLEPPDWDAAHAALAEALAAGSVLGDDGQIACPDALCRALRMNRSVYQRVLALYADGCPREHGRPRRLARSDLGFPRQSRAEEMLRALVAAGDVRFASRSTASSTELAAKTGLTAALGMSG